MRPQIFIPALLLLALLFVGCPNPRVENPTQDAQIEQPEPPTSAETRESAELPISAGQSQADDLISSEGQSVAGVFVEGEEEDLDGWIREWGQSRVSIANGLVMDRGGNFYIVGAYSRKADFDPGQNRMEIESIGENDIFISKFDPDGAFLWAKSYGGPAIERAVGMDIDSSGNLYIAGTFGRTTDFDPDPENIVPLTSGGRADCYILSVNSDGEYRWAKNWGGNLGDFDVFDIALSGSSVIVTGWYSGTVDFDPEEEEDPQQRRPGATARSASDAFISVFSTSGRFDRVSSWGGDTPNDQMTTTCIDIDSGGSIILAGRFQGRFEVAGTSGLDVTVGWHTSRGSEDAFLIKLDSRGSGRWARTWGGEFADNANSVAVTSGGSIFVLGGIDGTADLNPAGHNPDVHEVETYGFTFLSKFSPQGVYQWGRSFGPALGLSVASDSSGSAVLTGVAKSKIDFDPDRDEAAVDEKNGSVFVSKIDNSGDYKWSVTFGRTDRDLGTGILTDSSGSSGNIFLTGMYRGSLTWKSGTGFVYTSTTDDPNAFLMKMNGEGGW